MKIDREPFMTGVELLDEQHNAYLDLVENMLKTTVKSNITNADIQDEMNKIINYSVEHFEEEESLMRSLDYPFYEEHLAKHNLFRSKLDDTLEELDSETQVDCAEFQLRLSKWLLNWFREQVRNDDMKLVKFIQENNA